MASPASSSDWGEEIELDEAAEAQLSQIELKHATATQTRRPPHIDIELDSPESHPKTPPNRPPSLYQRFRSHRGLSVSDLVGTLWCEVQHSYRLSSKAHLPPAQRPATIQTDSGTPLVLNVKRTVQREIVLEKGREVHRVIEKEVMGTQEEVKVQISRKDEWWALRLVNLMVCLEVLLETGRAREIPTSGFVDGLLVFGVIDEVDRRQVIPSSPTNPRPTKRTTPDKRGASASSSSAKPSTPAASPSKSKAAGVASDQPLLEAFFSPASSPSKKGKEKQQDEEPLEETQPSLPSWGFVLSDTKTRYNHSLPPPADSRSSRLQLMLYHLMLSSLLTRPLPPATPTPPGRPAPFPWPHLYASLSISPNLPLSYAFLSSIQPILLGSPLLGTMVGAATTLQAFVEAVWAFGEMLGANEQKGPLEDTLEISYRLRNSMKRTWRAGRKSAREREEEDIRQAVEESLNGVPDAEGDEIDEDGALALAIALSMEGEEASGVTDDLQDVVRMEEDKSMSITDDTDDTFLPFLVQSPANRNPFMDLDEPSPFAEDADLPPNSQADATLADVAIGSSRYNLRRKHPLPPHSSSPSPSESPTISEARSPKHLRQTPPSPPPAPPPAEPAVRPPPSPSPSPEELLEGTLIGTDVFKYDNEELSLFLLDVLCLWRGERLPRGVSEQEAGRCRTCEFENGCEWRTQKAAEAVQRNRAKMAAA